MRFQSRLSTAVALGSVASWLHPELRELPEAGTDRVVPCPVRCPVDSPQSL